MKIDYIVLALLCYVFAGLNMHLWWMRDVFVWINFLSIIVLGLGGVVFTLMAAWEKTESKTAANLPCNQKES